MTVGIMILIGLGIIAMLIMLSKGNGGPAVYSNSVKDSHNTGSENSDEHSALMTSSDVGVMLEDPYEADADKGWFAKGIEDEFDMNPRTGNYNPDTSTEDVSSDDGGDASGGDGF